MGFIIDLSPRVSVELRRESFILHVGEDLSHSDESQQTHAEFDYQDAGMIKAALLYVVQSDAYQNDVPRRVRLVTKS